MPEASPQTSVTARGRMTARVAALPLWLHVRAHSTLSLLMAGVIASVVMVASGWRSLSTALEFFAVWACTGVVIYWGAYAWYTIKRKAV